MIAADSATAWTTPELDVQVVDTTWTFTLNRPDKLNALNAPLVDALLKAVAAANTGGARLLVFRGQGRSFCAGFDLSDLESQSEADFVLRFIRIELLLQAIGASPARTLALAQGKVFGAGVDLLAACHERIATRETVFRMPGLKFGLVLGTRRFGDIVGVETARQILEEVRPFDAELAREMGFVHEIAGLERWPALIERARAKASALDDESRAALTDALGRHQPHLDLSTLVRSAARFGLKDRLRAYVGR